MYKKTAQQIIRSTATKRQYSRFPSSALGTGANDGQFIRDAGVQLMGARTVGTIGEGEMQIHTWGSDWTGIQILLFTKLNVTLIFLPLGISSAFFNWGDLPTFWFNFLALIPLAGLLGNVTEELALHTGDLIGGLINATFGNAVEMILTVQALKANLLTVVQGTLLGSILSNLLLVLGMSFFVGGIYNHVQKFNVQGATCSTSLLLLASLAFIAPTVTNTQNISPEDILTISRLTAVLIALTYCLFLYFQLYTHWDLFKNSGFEVEGELVEEWPAISASTSTALLALITLIVAATSECLVSSIEGVTVKCGIPKSFIGVILLPIVGNAAEHATAVTMAVNNKPDLTMGVAVGSSTQIAMFMVPFAVLVGWGMGIPMTLAFSKVSATVLTFSILIVIGVVQDGESNWLEGVMLMVAYCIIAIVFWFTE